MLTIIKCHRVGREDKVLNILCEGVSREIERWGEGEEGDKGVEGEGEEREKRERRVEKDEKGGRGGGGRRSSWFSYNIIMEP